MRSDADNVETVIDLKLPIAVIATTLRAALTLIGAVLFVFGIMTLISGGPGWALVLMVLAYAIGYRLGLQPLRRRYAARA